MLVNDFRKSNFCALFNGDTNKAATLVSILVPAADADIPDDLTIQLAARVCEAILQEADPRFTPLDLADALLDRHPDRLEDILRLDDEAFNKVALLDAQACRHTWSDDQQELYDNPDEVIEQGLKKLRC